MPTCQHCQKTFGRKHSLTRHLREKHGDKHQRKIECQFCIKTFSRPEHYRRHLETQHDQTFALPTYPCPLCPSKSFKRKDYLRKHLQNCPVLQKIINQGEPSGTQFFPLKDIEQNELTTEALLRMPQTIDQSGSFAMETYCPLECIEQSESLGNEASRDRKRAVCGATFPIEHGSRRAAGHATFGTSG